MKAVVLERHGPARVLRVSDVASPVPGPGEVRVRLSSIGINYAEVLSRKGLYGWAPPLPYVLGMEGTGTIDAIGEGVTGRAVGERVIVGAQHGAYAEQIVVPAAQALPAFPDFSDDENAAVGVNYLTAWVALVEVARLRPGERVLITAAAGGVGTAAVQLASRYGCEVIAMAGSDEKLERVRALGASAVVNYRRPAFARALRDITGARGVDVALDVVGGEVFRSVWPVLAPFGRVVVAGFASLRLQRWNPLSWWRTWRDLPKADVRSLAPGSHGLLATHLGYLLPDAPRLTRTWHEVAGFIQRQGIRPVCGARFRFPDIAGAHLAIESRHSFGKVVVGL